MTLKYDYNLTLKMLQIFIGKSLINHQKSDNDNDE